MDAEDMEQMAGEYNPDYYCACGAEKNPDFPTCFQCSKREQREFDDWITNWQRNSINWDNQEPF